MRKVNFKTLSGNVFTIECEPDTTIQTLKPKLASLSNIAVDRQRLLYKAQVLEDSKKLSDYVKEDDQTVHLVERPAGAGVPGAPPNPQAAGFRMPPMGGPGGPHGGFPFPIPGGGFGAPPGGAGGPPPALANMLNNLMGSQPGAPGAPVGPPPNLSNIMRNLGNIVEQLERPPQSAQNAAAPPRPAPAQPAPAQQAAQAQPAGAGGQQVMQLPHQVLFRLGQICNHLNGPGASFPGPTMPQLQVERNLVVLLGSYMTNLVLQLQRLMPLMARAGDLMQRESLMNSQAERDLTQDLVQNLGKAMEDISRATGSVAHFYRTLNIGSAGANASVQVTGYEQSFKGIIEEVKSVQQRGAPASPAPQPQPTASQPAPASSAARPRSLDDMPDPLEQLQTVILPNDMVAIMMQNYAAANPLPGRMHDYVSAKKKDYGNNMRHAEHIGRRIQSQFSNAGCEDKIKNVSNLNPCDVAKEVFVDLASEIFDKIISEPPYNELEPFMEFMKPTCFKGLVAAMDELAKCFKNGTEDALEWIRANIYAYYKAQGCDALPPHMRENPAFVDGLYKGKTNTAFNMIRQMYARALELYPASQPQDADEEMKDEEEEKKEAEPPAANPLDRFRQIMAKDRAFIEQAKYDQGAPSRAYSSTCSFTRDKVLPMSEAVSKHNDYMKDRSKKLAEIEALPLVKDKIRRNLIINGGFPQAKVEEKLGTIGEIPKELAEAYLKMQKACVRFRLAQDDDFEKMQKDKHADAPQNPQMYNNLKDL